MGGRLAAAPRRALLRLMAFARARRLVISVGLVVTTYGVSAWWSSAFTSTTPLQTMGHLVAGAHGAAGPLVKTPRHRPTTRGRRVSKVGRAAAAAVVHGDDAVIMGAINSNAGDKARVLRSTEGLPKPPKDAVWLATGDWRVMWDSATLGGEKQKRLLKSVCPELPAVMVEFFAYYNRLYGDTYHWIQAFTVPGYERVDGAVVLSGPYKEKKAGVMEVEFTQVRFVTADSLEGESREVLVSAGLGKFLKPVKIKSEGKVDVEITYVSPDMSIQRDEVGTTYIFARKKIPFILD